MIKPEELIDVSIENSIIKIEKCLLDIQERIINAAKKGEFSYTYNGAKYSTGIIHYISNILSEMGYDTRCPSTLLEISWYNTKTKNTWKNANISKEEINKTESSKKEEAKTFKQDKPVQKSEGTKTTGKNSSVSSDTKE